MTEKPDITALIFQCYDLVAVIRDWVEKSKDSDPDTADALRDWAVDFLEKIEALEEANRIEQPEGTA